MTEHLKKEIEKEIEVEWESCLKFSIDDLVGGTTSNSTPLYGFPNETRIGVFFNDGFFEDDLSSGIQDFYVLDPTSFTPEHQKKLEKKPVSIWKTELTEIKKDGTSAWINLNRLHDQGASRVTELSWLLACIEHFKLCGLKTDTPVIIECSADEQNFLSMAFLRAIRKCLGTQPLQLLVFTSTRCFSRMDPWNNALRASSATATALWGGANVVFTAPFDAVTGARDHWGHRLARNTALILKSESGFTGTNDPAQGSFAIETLTDTLIQAAKKTLPRLLDQGFEVLIREDAEYFQSAYSSGKKSILGVTQFVPLSDPTGKPFGDETKIHQERIRFARVFEK